MGQSLWKTLIRPDLEEIENAERLDVAKAANVLEIGEFQLIQLAYHEWFGTEMPDGMIDPLFHAYMIDGEVPQWVRHYAQQVLRLAAADRLDSHAPHYHRYDPESVDPAPIRHRGFAVAAVFLILTVGGGFMLANSTTEESATLLPPYFSKETMRQGAQEIRRVLPFEEEMPPSNPPGGGA